VDPFEVDGEMVEIVGPRAFRVKSQSQPDLWYALDVDAPACGCKGFEIRQRCRHLDVLAAFVLGGGLTAADKPLVTFRLCTSRYQNTSLLAEAGALPVRITVGKPRWALPYELAGTVMMLAPKGIKGVVVEQPEFRRVYLERLEGFGVEKIRRAFSEIAALSERGWGSDGSESRVAPGQRQHGTAVPPPSPRSESAAPLLALLCYEDLSEPGTFCHRRMFAEWWSERTGEKVEELGGPIAQPLDNMASQ
jgi:hypothetical protein